MKHIYPVVALGLGAIVVTGCAGGTVTRIVTVPAAPPKSATPAAQQTMSSPPPSTPPSTSPAPAAPPASSVASAPPAPPANQIIVRLNGSGEQNTQAFTTPANWHLSWSYWDCPGESNFIVTEYNADGSPALNGVSVNELGTGRGPVATYAYDDAGTHYFQVISECSWSLVPVTS